MLRAIAEFVWRVFDSAACLAMLVAMTLSKLIPRPLDWIFPPQVERYQRYREAVAANDSYSPDALNECYEKSLAYAWRVFDDANKTHEALDGKLDSILRTAAALAAVLLTIITQFGSKPWILYVPSGALLTLAILVPAVARQAIVQKGLGKITASLETAGACGTEWKTDFDAYTAAAIHCAVVSKEIINGWKGDQLRRATWCLVGAVALLLIPLYKSQSDNKLEIKVTWPPHLFSQRGH